MVWFILTFIIGLAVGRKKFLPTALLQHPAWIVTPSLALLLFFLGLQIGGQPAILHSIWVLGAEGLFIAVLSMAGSAIAALIAYRMVQRRASASISDSRNGGKPD